VFDRVPKSSRKPGISVFCYTAIDSERPGRALRHGYLYRLSSSATSKSGYYNDRLGKSALDAVSTINQTQVQPYDGTKAMEAANASEEAAVFEHEPLDHTRPSIRLITTKPGLSAEGYIEYDISHMAIES
jgi:hypothetical protein